MYEDSTRTTVLGLSVCSSNDTEPSDEPQDDSSGVEGRQKGKEESHNLRWVPVIKKTEILGEGSVSYRVS